MRDVVQVCEVVAGGQAHPGLACGGVVGMCRQTKGVVEATVLQRGKAWLAIGEK